MFVPYPANDRNVEYASLRRATALLIQEVSDFIVGHFAREFAHMRHNFLRISNLVCGTRGERYGDILAGTPLPTNVKNHSLAFDLLDSHILHQESKHSLAVLRLGRGRIPQPRQVLRQSDRLGALLFRHRKAVPRLDGGVLMPQ